MDITHNIPCIGDYNNRLCLGGFSDKPDQQNSNQRELKDPVGMEQGLVPAVASRSVTPYSLRAMTLPAVGYSGARR